ncbi:MAG: hypothetical protein JXB05_19235 [Myxococcaceae bacterium]|nr:hypothetical protein [Myxococcaceae bacterium]
MSKAGWPGMTHFERCVVLHEDKLEIGRRYLQAFGIPNGVGAIIEDMNEGRLSWEKAQQVLSHTHYLFIEHIARRVGFTRFSDVYKDPEFVTLQVDSLAGNLQRHGPFPQERRVQALESFAWNSLRQWHLVAHELGGRNVYDITPRLAEALRPSGSSEPPWRAPRLPMPSLLMLVPPEAELSLKLEGFPAREVTEIYAVEAPAPGHQWAVWVHAPIHEALAESVYLELPFSEEGTFEEGLARAHDLFQEDSPAVEGWRDCVRWFAAAMRYLAEGGVHQERSLQPEEQEPGRRVLLGAPEALH